MSIDLKVLGEVDLGFPGIEIGSEQAAIDVFVQNIPEYVGFASEQYSIRTRRLVELEARTLGQEEYFQKLDDIENRAINELPQFYYRQASMMLWTHFEWSMKRLLNYAIDKDPELPPFSSRDHKLQADTFCKSIKRYYKNILKEINTLDHNRWQSLENFNTLRSNIAHSNGSIAGLNESK